MKKIAIVVGVDSYEPPYNKLTRAIDDARKVAGFLERRLGFKVLFLANPTASQVEATLLRVAPDPDAPLVEEDAEYRLEDDSIFFFYFAGHGLCVGGAPGQSLLCSDANSLLVKGVGGALGAVSPDAMSAISRAGRGYMFFCYDVCQTAGRAGAAPQEGGAGLRDATAFSKDSSGNRSALRGVRLTLSSCADGCQANDDGAFATALVEEMARLLNAGCEVRLDQALVDRVATKLDPDQRPELAGTPFTLVSGLKDESEAPKLIVQQSQPFRKAGTRMTLNIKGVTFPFRWISAGSFMMGTPMQEQEEALANAKEYFDDVDSDYYNEVHHKVNISRGFWMLESPITQGMWKSVMWKNPSCFKGSKRLPVENISWKDCQNYIKKLNELAHGKKVFFSFSQGKPEIDGFPEGFAFSLPTEAEWEYACRAGTTTPYWFGSTLNGDKANCNGNYPYGTDEKGPYLEKTTEVGKYPANAWGLVDMHGNVWEWVQDWYGDYPTEEVTDPTGPEGGSRRVLRGGGGNYNAVFCRAARRFRNDPDYRFDFVGARLVLRPLG